MIIILKILYVFGCMFLGYFVMDNNFYKFKKGNNMNQFLLRWTSPSPLLFKRITSLCTALATAGGGILGIPSVMASQGIVLALPEIVTKIAGYMIAAGVVGGIISKITVEDPSQLTTTTSVTGK